MAALRQESSYGLSCAQNNKNTNQSLYCVKLTDTAIRMLETYQNQRTSLSNQPVICFEENQGYIKIPAPTPDSPDATTIFRFNLSSERKENPQSSFDCIRQEGRDHLESEGSIQGKITVCATDDSYKTTRERMCQVEKDSWSRSTTEIKPGPSKRVKVQRKRGLMPDLGTSNHSRWNKRSYVLSPVVRRPLRDRLIHLLALKPYKKPELVLWLARERANPKDRAELTSVLEEVSKRNPEDGSYSLKPELLEHVQRDWPGYLEEEKQIIHRLLSSRQLKSPQSSHSLHQIAGSPSPASPVRNPSVKRPLPSDLSSDGNPKKQRSLVQPVPRQTPTNPAQRSFHGTSANTADLHKGHREEKPVVNLTSTTLPPDYVKKYSTITTPEQRQKYEDDFDVEYEEYRAIHDRIAAASQMFVQLSSKLDTLLPGTEAYQRMQDHVLEEYRNYQKKFPAYRAEKKQCVYLHHKLAHIKRMMEDYGQGQSSPRNWRLH